jgi:hypothetical protein
VVTGGAPANLPVLEVFQTAAAGLRDVVHDVRIVSFDPPVRHESSGSRAICGE